MRQNRHRIYLDARGGFRQRLRTISTMGHGDRPGRSRRKPRTGRNDLCVVAAEAGNFRSEGRGQFNEDSLRTLQTLWPAAGLPSHIQHPNILDDKTEKFLGRCKTPRRSLTIGIDQGGHYIAVPCIRSRSCF